MSIGLIIPALNEAASIGQVISAIPPLANLEIVVVDNGSTDQTAQIARENGATVLAQPHKGYGRACLMGIDYFKKKYDKPDTIVFMDGDFSDYPSDIIRLLEEINNGADIVIGSRAMGNSEKKSMTSVQRFGNWLSSKLLYLRWQVSVTDLGPFRAIKWEKLLALEMKDKTYGWTVEMQAKALKKDYNYVEIPVNYRERIGVSKVSGTLKGAFLAGYKILFTIAKHSF